jgi:hypothetical protein
MTDQHQVPLAKNDIICAIVDVQLYIFKIKDFTPGGFPLVMTWDYRRHKFIAPLHILRSQKLIKIDWRSTKQVPNESNL